MKIRITFTEPLLGTLSGDNELAKDYILTKHPNGISQDELDAQQPVEEVTEKASTIFAREDGKPMLWDYQIKGFFKDACSMSRRAVKVKKDFPSELTAYKKVIDGLIFVKPRKIILNLSGELIWTERPLRASTAQGERIALARSETAPIGTSFDIEILLLKESLLKYVKLWLDYGALRGIGQWRNSGMGRFEWQELKSK